MKGLCQVCFRSNSAVHVVDGITTCLKCNRVKGNRNARKCIDCDAVFDIRESGMGMKVRCDLHSKENVKKQHREYKRRVHGLVQEK